MISFFLRYYVYSLLKGASSIKKKSAILMACVTIVAAVAIALCIFNWSFISKTFLASASTKISYYADNVSSLTHDSTLVITGTATDETNKYIFEEENLIKTKVKITKVLKGRFDDENIQILQIVCDNDPRIEPGEEVVLFMNKYDGPICDNCYICVGLYQGHYKIENNKIIPSRNIDSPINREIKSFETVLAFENKITSLK